MPPQPQPLISRLRSCWECQRRRRRCDLTLPQCNKCLAEGKTCPGYEENKPVTWLVPGIVLSRPRKRKPPQPTRVVTSSKVVSNVDNTVRGIEVNYPKSVPIFDWTDETTLMVETVDYCKLRHRDLVVTTINFLAPTLELGPNPYTVRIQREWLHYLSVPYRHSLISLVMAHRIHQLPEGTMSVILNKLRLRIYEHYAIAVQALRHRIERNVSGLSISIAYDIFSVMVAELQLTPLEINWRIHYNGFMQMVSLRGGLENLFQGDVTYQYGLLGFMIVGIMANTTAQASKQIATATYFSSTSFISKLYENVIYPTVLCPNPLLMHIITINHIRHEVSNSHMSLEDGQTRAMALVHEIEPFSAEAWVKAGAPLRRLWLIAGRVYHSAAILYCIASFQAISLLPKDPRISLTKTIHSGQLYDLLQQAVDAPQLRSSMCWPLVIAGVLAEGRYAVHRPFLIRSLVQLSRDTGIALPLASTAVLEAYWASGKRTWEDCFNDPRAFTW